MLKYATDDDFKDFYNCLVLFGCKTLRITIDSIKFKHTNNQKSLLSFEMYSRRFINNYFIVLDENDKHFNNWYQNHYELMNYVHETFLSWNCQKKFCSNQSSRLCGACYNVYCGWHYKTKAVRCMTCFKSNKRRMSF